MNNYIQSYFHITNKGRSFTLNLAKARRSLVVACLALVASALLAPSASAQTITLSPTNSNIFVGGGNYSGVYSNFQIKASISSPSATVPFTLGAYAPPAGVTVGFSTNNFTNTMVVTLTITVANVAQGIYPLAITNNVTGAYTTNLNLIVGTLWTNLNTADVRWSTPANWSGGVPVSGSDVMFQDAGQTTNFVDSSTTINSLTYIRSLSASNYNTTIASGATLSVLGTNGFAINVDSTTANNKLITVNLFGSGGGLVVSNQSANFTVSSDSTGTGSGGNGATTVNMTNLDNFTAVVNRFGLGDVSLDNQGGVGAQNVVVSFAKTNLVTALFKSDLTGTNTLFFGLSLFNDMDPFNNGSANIVNLGATNAIFADSIAVGQSRCGAGGNVLRFNPVFTNGIAGYAFFRNTNGGRISLFGVGVDSGNSNPGSNAKGTLFFSGGTVDMLVDTMWLGRNRNSTLTNNGAAATGGLTFGPGKVDVNQLRMGYNEYTNNSWAQGTLLINTNGILTVNNYLELGFVAGDYTGTGSQAAQSFGQVTINGGTARVNQVIVQPGSTNNQITLNAGGNLIVSNTVASPTNSLTTLTFSTGGAATLFVTANVTNIYVTNLVATTGGGGKINIASVSGFASYPATNVLISYQTAASHTFAIGTLPPGFNNMQINDNTGNKTIELIISTNQPKNLAWRGGQDSNWNHSSLNWLDLAALTVTKFTDGDTAVFDDTPGVPVNVTITDSVFPGQSGTGILVTNSVNAFIFNNNGGGAIGGTSLIKTGSGSLEIDLSTAAAAQVQNGNLIGSGIIASANVSSNAAIDFSGTISGTFSCAGQGVLEAGSFVNGPMTLQSGSVVTNSGTVQGGALTMQSGTSLYNSGTLGFIGAATVATNSTFINAGAIGVDGLAGNSITVDGTFKDLGTGITTLFLDSFTLEGNSSKFVPGGDGIGTTQFSFNHQTTGHTLIRLLAGSTTIFKVNLANVPPYTTIDAERFVFGPNHTPKLTDGCTLAITNLGAPYTAPQSLGLFVNSYSGPAIGDAGLNTTNSYPVIIPASPGTGLSWDVLSDLRPDGVVKIIGIATNPTNITPTFTVTSSNIVTEISWPSDHIGWNLQQLTTTTAVGVTATNWVSIFGSTLTNDVVITNATVTADAAIFYRLSSQ